MRGKSRKATPRSAIEPAREFMAGDSGRFNNRQIERVVRFSFLSAKTHPLYAHKVDSVGDLVGAAAIGGVKAGDLAFHAAPSFSTG